MPKPHPVPVNTICSECGLSWDSHPQNPTLADCVHLLLAAMQGQGIQAPWGYPTPNAPYYPPNPLYPSYPFITYTTSDNTVDDGHTLTVMNGGAA